jgi:hypothetical protein
MKQSICIVTEEWPGIAGCGGIGTAFYELAILFARNQYQVHILFVPIIEEPDSFKSGIQGIQFHILDIGKYTYGPFTYQKKALPSHDGWINRLNTIPQCIFATIKDLGSQRRI